METFLSLYLIGYMIVLGMTISIEDKEKNYKFYILSVIISLLSWIVIGMFFCGLIDHLKTIIKKLNEKS